MRNFFKLLLFLIFFIITLGLYNMIITNFYLQFNCNTQACREFGRIFIFIISFILSCSTVYIINNYREKKRS